MHRLAAFLLGFCPLAAAGCLEQQTVQSDVKFLPDAKVNKIQIDQPRLEPNAKIVKAPELPPKLPAPATCVMAAKCLIEAGDRADADPALRKENYLKAKFEFERALQGDPKCVDAVVGIARIHDKLGNHEEAVKGYRKALTLAPQSPEIWFEAGMSFNQHDQLAEAVECLRHAAALEPGHAGYSNHLIMTLAKAGLYEEALAHLLKRMPEDRAHYNVARMANHFGRRDLCGRHLQAALQVNPNLTEAQQMWAVLLAAQESEHN